MRGVVLIGMIGALFVSTTIAQAQNGNWAWTEAKAAKMVTLEGKVRLAASERAPLNTELNDAV